MIVNFVMYVLWILTIIAVLATTFTNYQYMDLNMIAVVLLIFALLNSYFVTSHRKK